MSDPNTLVIAVQLSELTRRVALLETQFWWIIAGIIGTLGASTGSLIVLFLEKQGKGKKD